LKILIAPDSFKGSMSSIEIIEILSTVAHKYFSPLEIVKLPIADGGEGTIDAFIAAFGGEYIPVEVTGPEGNRVKASYGIIKNNIAVIEMAQASGLTLVPPENRNPLKTTSFGTGEIIKIVLDKGIRKIIIGIGGSATNDGGVGAMQALGVQFLDHDDQEAGAGGQYLSRIRRINLDNLHKAVQDARITVICDVNNPLTGKNGATYVYGPQKGATSAMIELLEAGMKNYADVVKRDMNIDLENVSGAGAAGGLGGAAMVFLNAELRPGIDTVLNMIQFNAMLKDVDLVITGEGMLDGQSVFGKVPVGIAGRCKKKGVPVVAIVGKIGKDAARVYDYGINSIVPAINRDMSIEYALKHSKDLLTDASDRMFRLLKVGMKLTL